MIILSTNLMYRWKNSESSLSFLFNFKLRFIYRSIHNITNHSGDVTTPLSYVTGVLNWFEPQRTH